jgi:hypothetical protein
MAERVETEFDGGVDVNRRSAKDQIGHKIVAVSLLQSPFSPVAPRLANVMQA